MLVLPAIDILGGRCVRLKQGDYAQETVFDDDPVAVAKRWVDQGGEFLHLVDLDGAKEGKPINTQVIADIARTCGVPVELGGGLRTEESVSAALDLGVCRVIIGTRAVAEPQWFADMADRFAGKLVLGLDAKNGRVALEGWRNLSDLPVLDVIRRYQQLPLAAVVYTDISKDGMMSGPNFEATVALARSTPHPVIASGGITTIDDVLEFQRKGIGACILGRSIYEGSIDLKELLNRLREDPQEPDEEEAPDGES